MVQKGVIVFLRTYFQFHLSCARNKKLITECVFDRNVAIVEDKRGGEVSRSF